ncbi:hypothetical protein AUJ78_01650 [Candidatus Peregrinibacteria bacterium CG1_02_41_10]|nr:MAG: hypothetical protein AUJ78_01650 [Candidatus Peregrinibacteria bacterium CG1_02_41_10]
MPKIFYAIMMTFLLVIITLGLTAFIKTGEIPVLVKIVLSFLVVLWCLVGALICANYYDEAKKRKTIIPMWYFLLWPFINGRIRKKLNPNRNT